MIAVEYPKIETLYNRNKETFRVIEGEYRCAEFGLIRPEAWFFQEKIDGTNIRVQWDGEKLEIGGRTNNAQLAGDLVANILKALPVDKVTSTLTDANPIEPVILFGEGYGPGIQKGGGLYRAEKGFILFDVRVGEWWLEWSKVKEIARALDLPHVPVYDMTLEEVQYALVMDNLRSLCSKDVRMTEGVIMRTEPTVRFRHGGRVMAKLKAVDFQHGKQ